MPPRPRPGNTYHETLKNDGYEIACGGPWFGQCVAVKRDEQVHVRDTKDEHGELVFTQNEWRDFIDGVKKGKFDV